MSAVADPYATTHPATDRVVAADYWGHECSRCGLCGMWLEGEDEGRDGNGSCEAYDAREAE